MHCAIASMPLTLAYLVNEQSLVVTSALDKHHIDLCRCIQILLDDAFPIYHQQ